jgi:hypothetical protein
MPILRSKILEVVATHLVKTPRAIQVVRRYGTAAALEADELGG